MKDNNREAIKVACAIIEMDGKVLAVQRSESMSLPLKWEFPGGKLENDESEEECIKREINEELQIDIEPYLKLSSSVYCYPDFTIELIPFVSKFINGNLKLIEHKRSLWLYKEELLSVDWAEADLPIINEYCKL